MTTLLHDDPTPPLTASAASRWTVLVYGVAVYGLFFCTFGYLIAFVLGLPMVPHTLDRGPLREPALAAAINAGLLTLFALQHSVMARPFFKRWIERYIPQAAERPTYCLATCLVLIALFAFWSPIPAMVWSLEAGWAQVLLRSLAVAGFGLVFVSSLLLNHFELFGLQQPLRYFRGQGPDRPKFRVPVLYRFVRHPIYLGMLLAIWSTPQMTMGHLLFSVLCTGYLIVGSTLEERDLVDALGSDYSQYQQQVGKLLPIPGRTYRG